jgi:murein DD-endopeptidase MepM/ murein hydrolase activator NlpD
LRKRFYILLVSRDSQGELRKIPIPLHYLYVFLAGALIGMLTITGMAGSYARMLAKVASFNELRIQKEALKTQYSQLEEVTREREIQVASLGSLASEVAALYGLRTDKVLVEASRRGFQEDEVALSVDRLYDLRHTALTGAAAIGIGMGLTRNVTTADWMRAYSTPNLWPVQGRITGGFGERMDPFHGEGAFHSGVDISTEYGERILAPADGVVTFSGFQGGYGKIMVLQHANGISTRFGHMSSFAKRVGQTVRRGEVIGYVGTTGRTTGPHLHYEVRVHNAPVNPYRYLRHTWPQTWTQAAGD